MENRDACGKVNEKRNEEASVVAQARVLIITER